VYTGNPVIGKFNNVSSKLVPVYQDDIVYCLVIVIDIGYCSVTEIDIVIEILEKDEATRTVMAKNSATMGGDSHHF
jgi:hypothetical protein